jgi:hypothetical protein
LGFVVRSMSSKDYPVKLECMVSFSYLANNMSRLGCEFMGISWR